MNIKDKMYHINLSKSDIGGAKYAILPGDPGRVGSIAKYLENPKKISQNREYTAYLGNIKKEKVLIISTGMGGPSTAICVEELAMIGITHLISIGTSGGMQLDVKAGDLVIATSAIRQEGTSNEYLPVEFPAVADLDITNALVDSVKDLKLDYHTGVVQCKDSFYGQHNPKRMPVSYELENKWNAWIKGGALCSEMETASLFIVSSALRLKAGAILLVIWNQEREKAGLSQEENFDTDRAIKVVIKAIEKLITEG